MTRRRLDAELVRRGLAESRGAAKLLIDAGEVLVSGAVADKAARMVGTHEPVVVVAPPPAFVGRAGGKLDAALRAFGLDVAGRRAIDVGASTGGFTDCLLQRGAEAVVALDVGHGQLHERLRADPRVSVVERCNVRDLAPAVCSDTARRQVVGDPASLVVADLSFISLRTVRDALVALVAPDGDLVVLIKPQFEAGRAEVSRGGGVISDPAIWASTVGGVVEDFAACGMHLVGLVVSEVRGTAGNVEFVAWLNRSPVDDGLGAGDARVAAVVSSVAQEQACR
jgi:23S rRNA (cytidine1920-2'-O)/16S rRNA (cytidine1409-2'-O)-methyltransferase